MKNSKGIIIGVIVILLFIVSKGSMYVIYEDEVGIVKNFSAITKVIVNKSDVDLVKTNLEQNGMSNVGIVAEKGLHFKIPFIQSVEKYDAKYLTYISRPETINTRDRRTLDIRMYAQYRIIDSAKFNVAVASKAEANKKIDIRVYPIVIQSVNTLTFDEFFEANKLETLIYEKLEELNKQLLNEFGIYVTDIGLNRKNFPFDNIDSIENKMSKQIEKESEKLIAEGNSAYDKAKAKTDRQRKELLAEAVEQAAIIRAEADAEALKIYQYSLQKDLEFYKFIQRMEIYKELEKTTIFLDKDNDLLDLINGY